MKYIYDEEGDLYLIETAPWQFINKNIFTQMGLEIKAYLEIEPDAEPKYISDGVSRYVLSTGAGGPAAFRKLQKYFKVVYDVEITDPVSFESLFQLQNVS